MVVRLGSLLAIVALACSGKSKSDAPFGVDKGGTGGVAGRSTAPAGRGGAGGASAGGASGGRASTGGAGGSSGTAQSGAGVGGATAGTSSGATGGSSGMSDAGRSAGGSGSGSGGDGATGGSSGEAGSSTGGSTGGSAGTGGSGGAGGTGSSVGGAGPMPGFRCYSDATCKTGERCVVCNHGETATALCAPDPDEDPSGYQAATAACTTVETRYSDCDGPEDCANGEYCAYGGTAQTFGAKCQSEPAPEPAFCCFTCDAMPVCTLCWNDTDCPVGYLCTPNLGSPNNVGGCRVAD